jgi:voltage-gated potassium channel
MDARSRRIADRFEIPMLVAALLVIPMLVIEQSHLGPPWETIGDVLNWGTWLAFVVELVVMLAVVPNRGRWLREHPVDVIATVLTPPILPAGLATARLLRLLRVLRLARLAPLMRRVFTVTGVRYAGLMAFLTVLIGGTAYADVEKAPTEWDGIWWAASTMTTVGYGDQYPQTDAGRIIALVVMFIGIGFGTLLIGSVAQRFLATDVDEVETREDQLLAELRALHARLERLERRL